MARFLGLVKKAIIWAKAKHTKPFNREKMRSNPRDWRIEQLKSLADAHGVDYRQPGTSNVTFRHPNGVKLTIPAHKPIALE